MSGLEGLLEGAFGSVRRRVEEVEGGVAVFRPVVFQVRQVVEEDRKGTFRPVVTP